MKSWTHHVSAPGSDRALAAHVTRAGEDIVVVVAGGTMPHVGAVVLAQPHASTAGPERVSASISVLTIPPHKEEPVARPIAEAVCAASGRVTVVTAGVHENALDRQGIETFLELARTMARELAADPRIAVDDPPLDSE